MRYGAPPGPGDDGASFRLGRQVRHHGVEHRPALVGDAQIAVGQGLDEADGLELVDLVLGDACGRRAWRSARGRCPRAGAGPSPAVRRPPPPRSGCRRWPGRCPAGPPLLPLEGQFFGGGGVALVVDQQPAMRARADAGIFAIAPVEQVVPALLARAGRGWKSRRPAGPRVSRQFLGQLVEVGARSSSGIFSLPAWYRS